MDEKQIINLCMQSLRFEWELLFPFQKEAERSSSCIRKNQKSGWETSIRFF